MNNSLSTNISSSKILDKGLNYKDSMDRDANLTNIRNNDSIKDKNKDQVRDRDREFQNIRFNQKINW